MPKNNNLPAPTSTSASNSERDFVTALVDANKRSRSWREKLAAVQELLADQLSVAQPDPQKEADVVLRNLVDVAIYARFLAAGQIHCEEDGRHFRPAHHSRIAQNIQEQLVRYSNPPFTFVTRQIYPWLPSTDQRFQSAEPLTRIRDIAHRNDIPSELKREIKETLQNKLHRCAGPEDLVTSRRLLERITAPGAGYSAEFVEQFRIFHRELEEFFNASSLEDQLQVLREAAPAQAKAVDQFLKHKSRGAGTIGGAEKGGVPTAALGMLRLLTDLRRGLQGELQSKSAAERQSVQLADIRLEEFAFVLLSKIANELEDAFKNKPERSDWDKSLEALQCCVVNAGLGGVSQEECVIIENELRAWSQNFDSSVREDCLRLKATVERAQRLSEAFADEVMALFPREAERLGRALGVAEPAVRVFGEAEIRRHVVFQLSKLASLLIRRLRDLLGDSGWEILVSGLANGRLQVIDSLEKMAKAGTEPALVLLRQAHGDEELPTEVAGVVLAQEIPHLSHLAVRARQAGVVFVTCEVPDMMESLRKLEGRVLSLTATVDEVRWTEENSATASSVNQPQSPPAAQPRIAATNNGDGSLLKLNEATPETAGPKAFGARRLMEIAQDSGALFKALDGKVIPFGAMEQALEASPALDREYEQAIGGLESANDDEFDGMVEQLGRLASGLTVPQRFISGLAKQFDTNTRLMARSSSNCEDMETSAGAGLYESVPNVLVDKIESAVRQVWSSLWTRRAARDRRRVGIPQMEAHMAVLLQPMLAPEYSFVIHTANPVNGDRRQVYIELAVGLGETLVSAANHGSPYRFVYDKETGATRLLAFANLSQALQPSAGGGIEKRLVDYSECELSIDPDARGKLVKRLGQAAEKVETAFNTPMDIEGAVVKGEVYFVQARPQQGLDKASAASDSAARAHTNQRARREPSSGACHQPAEPAEVAQVRPSQASPPALPCKLLGLFEKRVAGDDSLLQLARLRFEQAGLAAEVHAGSPEQLDWILSFVPGSTSQPTVHLPRDFNFGDPQTRAKIRELASRFNGRIAGLLLHDRGEWERQPEAFVQAAQDMDSMLARDKSDPLVFLEYAAGLEPAQFAELFDGIRHLERVTAAVDVGHVGIQSIRAAYQKMHADADVCRLKDRPAELPTLMPDLECAVAAALPSVVGLITALGALGKPLHFHLHDGHPLSKASAFGVADHLSFKAEIPLDFENRGRRSVGPMYGPAGLNKIIATALGAQPSGSLSFTLEIHPTNERRALADAERLFPHWRDKTNAEIMNHWLWVLTENAELMKEALKLPAVKH